MKKKTLLLIACICVSAAIVGCSKKADTVSSDSINTDSTTESVSDNTPDSDTTESDTDDSVHETTSSVETTEIDDNEKIVSSNNLTRDDNGYIICKLDSYSITYATTESDIFVLETVDENTTAATFITNNKTNDECAVRLYSSSDSPVSDGSLYHRIVSSSEKLTDNNGKDYFVLTDSEDDTYMRFVAYADSKDIIAVTSTTSAMLDAITISK